MRVALIVDVHPAFVLRFGVPFNEISGPEDALPSGHHSAKADAISAVSAANECGVEKTMLSEC
jgi:hypothetical protein